MTHTRIFSAEETEALLPFHELLPALKQAALDKAAHTIICPERHVIPTPSSENYLLSMPALGTDLLATKILTIFPKNRSRPAIQGALLCNSAEDGRLLFTLDGPTVTKRRTAAMSLLAIKTLTSHPIQNVLIIGTGQQAIAHIEALNALYPDATITIRGRTAEAAKRFCSLHAQYDLLADTSSAADDTFNVVITTTSSSSPVFDAPPSAKRLVIAVGAYRPDMAEIAPSLVQKSCIFVDDWHGARAEAGDLLQADIDWKNVHPLISPTAITPSPSTPLLFKSVGCGAWDLAACRVASQFITSP